MIPSTQVAQAIYDTWKEVLGVKDIGTHDRFFDLGGNSLLLANVHQRLADRLDVPLTVLDLFRHPTIHALAQQIERMRQSRWDEEIGSSTSRMP